MGLNISKKKYVIVTFRAYGDKNISGFKNNEIKITTVYGNTVLDALHDFNKFRRPDNKVHCHNPEDNNISIKQDIDIFVELK